MGWRPMEPLQQATYNAGQRTFFETIFMRICWSNAALIAVVVILGTLSMLAGCGQKGDLYLPDREQQDTQR